MILFLLKFEFLSLGPLKNWQNCYWKAWKGYKSHTLCTCRPAIVLHQIFLPFFSTSKYPAWYMYIHGLLCFTIPPILGDQLSCKIQLFFEDTSPPRKWKTKSGTVRSWDSRSWDLLLRPSSAGRGHGGEPHWHSVASEGLRNQITWWSNQSKPNYQAKELV